MRGVADRCAGLVSAWCCRYLVGKLKAIPIEAAEEQANKEEVVESLRMMAELIIWGDQNNSSVLECAYLRVCFPARWIVVAHVPACVMQLLP